MSAENEIRVFGPPGTGKTTWMAGTVKATAKARGSGRIVVASFTVAAAAEIAGRDLPLRREQVGTLHALAYRAIGRPPVAEEVLSEWNKRHPALALSRGYRDIEQAPVEWKQGTDGDVLLMQVETMRARRVPEEMWPQQARHFNLRWEEWKADEGVVDFTDMISLAIDDTEAAPGEPLVGFFDEVQDFTPLELALVRHWGKRMDRVVLAGDDDQCIYGFKGSTPDAFLDPPLPEAQKRVLRQSYRLPAAVHEVAERWVRRLTRREVKEYQPREAEGRVRHAQLRYDDPEPVVNDVLRQIDAGRQVMVLTTCGYMLDRIKWSMREHGVPFHNPYRRSRGDWNPLSPSRGTSSATRLLTYLVLDERLFGAESRPWTGKDVRTWAEAVKKRGTFRPRALESLPDRELTFEEVIELFVDEDVAARVLEPDVGWFASQLTAAIRERMEFPLAVLRRRGVSGLTDVPSVVLGTIHSVKGGEADVVYLFPDLSVAGLREWDDRRTRDQTIRQMYVGMTRAKEELVICAASTPYTVDPALMLGEGAAVKRNETHIRDSIVNAIRRLDEPSWARTLHIDRFQEAGEPDVDACVRGVALKIEVKVPGREADPIQVSRLRRWRRAGAVAGVAHSVEEAMQLVQECRIRAARASGRGGEDGDAREAVPERGADSTLGRLRRQEVLHEEGGEANRP